MVNSKLKIFIGNHYPKILSVGFFVLLFSAYIYAFANPPGSPYQGGATLDPTCTPGSVNCFVQIIPDQTSHAGEYLTTNGSVTSWGAIAPFVINDGSGTTANGSAVDLGGTVTSNTLINMSGSSFEVSTGTVGLLLYPGPHGMYFHSSVLGDFNSNGNGTILQIHDDTSIASITNTLGDTKVGINTASPGVALDVVGSVNSSGVIKVDSGNISDIYIKDDLNMGRVGLFASTGSDLVLASTDLTKFYYGDNNLVVDITNGNIGVGTNAPNSFKLEVMGNVGPEATGTRDLGSASKVWHNVYANNFIGGITPSGFTQGSVVFAGTGGMLSQNNLQLFWDNTTNRLGVGTASPGYKLDVNGTIHSTGVASFDAGVTNIGQFTQYGSIFQQAADPLYTMYDNSTSTSVNLQYSGSKLLISKPVQVTGALTFNTDNTYDLGASGAIRPRTGYFGTSVNTPLIQMGGTTSSFPEIKRNGTAINFRLADDSADAPITAGQLTVPLLIGGTGVTSTLIYKTTTGVGTTGADHIFQVGTNGATEAMRILNSGNVGIGTTAPASGNRLDIDGGNLVFHTDNTYDIGASGATRPRTGYFGTSITAPNAYFTPTVTTGTGTTAGVQILANSLTTGNGLDVSSNSLTSGNLVSFSSNTSALAASNTQTILNVSTSGANPVNQTTYGGYFSNTHTGTNSVNTAIYATASGGSNNYAANFGANLLMSASTPCISLQLGTCGSSDNYVGRSSTTVTIQGSGGTTVAVGGTSYIDAVASKVRLFTAGSGEVLINTSVDSGAYALQVSGNTFVTGNALFGTNTSSGTTTPENISLGGTYGSNTAGNVGNLKIDLYNDGTANRSGFGISANKLEYQTPASTIHAFYVGGNLIQSIDDNSVLVKSGLFSTSTYSQRIGNLLTQNYQSNNTTIVDNAYYNGTSWTRLATGYASGIQMYNGHLMMVAGATGTGNFTPTYPFKANSAGTVGIGGDGGNVADTFTGNTLVATSTAVGIKNASPGFALHVGSASITDGTTLLRIQDINSTCDFNANTGAPTCGSDLTLKKDVSSLNITDLLSKVSALNPVSYHWLTEDGDAPLQNGFIAQEVEVQFPDLVSEHTWIDGSTKKFLNMSGLMPYVVGAVKEMDIKIQGLSSLDTTNTKSLGSLIKQFLADVGNGLDELFVKKVHTEQLCVKKSDGTDVCITGDQLQQLLGGSNTNSNGSGTSGAGSGGDSGSGDTSNTGGGSGAGDSGVSTSRSGDSNGAPPADNPPQSEPQP